MSRSVKGSKGPGYDYWSRRPPNSGVQCPGAFSKLLTHRKERRESSRIAREEAMRDIAAEDEYLYRLNLDY